MASDGWISVKEGLPEDDIVVMTKILDQHGERNEQPMIRDGRLWFFQDRSMYVYYAPTHWKPMPLPEAPDAD